MNRYKYAKRKEGSKLYNIYYPTFTKGDNDIYIYSKDGDRLDNLAHRFYKDSSLWWIIAKANELKSDSLFLEAGIRLWIPKDIEHLQETLKKINE